MATAPRSHARRRPVALGAVVTAAAALGWAGTAAAATEVLVARSSGLSAPTGVVQVDGARWVADAALGVCRVPADGPGLVEDLYCSPETAPHAGPLKATGLVFDPGTSNFYSGDGQSNLGAIWRLHYDAARGAIDRADRVADLGDDRASAIALQRATTTAPAALVYTTKRSALVRRLPDPAAGRQVPETLGTAGRADARGVAVLDRAVYVADGSGVARLPLAGGGARTASAVPGTAGIAASALAADPERGRLYVGTSIPELTDDVVALEPATGAVETYERGFSAITGMGVDAWGGVLVADDPGAGVGAIDSLQQGRLFRVPFAPLGRSRTVIDAAPAAWSSASSVTFAFSSDRKATFECRLDGAAWTTCATAVTYDDLSEGAHAFEVRATTAIGTGPAARRVFVLDRTAPAVEVGAPGATVPFGGGRIDMAADEAPVAYWCAVDGAEPALCEPGEALPAGLGVGDHTLRVTAVDSGGNAAAAVTRTFAVLPPPAPTPVSPAPVPPAAVDVPVADLAAPAPAAPSAPPAAPATTVAVPTVADAPVPPAVARVAMLRIRPNRVATRHGVRTVRLSFETTPDARVAHVAILRGRSEAALARIDVPLQAGTMHRLAVRLPGGLRLQPGVYRVTVQVTGADGRRGNRGDHRLWIKRRAARPMA